MSKQTIAAPKSNVNAVLPENEEKSEKFGTIKAAPIQPADKLVNSEDKTLRLEALKSLIRRTPLFI